tara:strand:+ start:216 stop:386 length:171 start_codon:yes stop_codon:yes gene_type:complete
MSNNLKLTLANQKKLPIFAFLFGTDQKNLKYNEKNIPTFAEKKKEQARLQSKNGIG